jgi:two-component system phosphate regulon sensor histidine kinase PhoR|tara:strand:+ start:888 stop:1925 length:1038 start_codon:yes stop_codon:yes gene_type:complete
MKIPTSILDHIEDPIIVLNTSLKIEFQNEATNRLFDNDQKGQHISLLVRDPAFLEYIENTMVDEDNEGIEITFDSYIQKISKEPITFLFNVKKGDELLFLILKNITELKRKDLIKSSFISNVSHEMKTPLSSIIGFIETIKNSAKDDEAAKRKFINIIEKESLRMKRLLDDLMAFNHIETEENIKPKDKINLNEVIQEIATNLEYEANKKNMQIKTENIYDLNVLGNYDNLLQVFSNLIENAIKYANKNTKILINFEQQKSNNKIDQFALVKIKDFGPGIEKSHISRLTERFYTVDQARSRSVGGTGLGLSIVKHILNRHGGKLIIESEVGKGSSFTVKIPIYNH